MDPIAKISYSIKLITPVCNSFPLLHHVNVAAVYQTLYVHKTLNITQYRQKNSTDLILQLYMYIMYIMHAYMQFSTKSENHWMIQWRPPLNKVASVRWYGVKS